MTKLIDYTLVSIAVPALAWFAVWSYRDIFRENRPVTTEEDILNAYNVMLEENDFTFDDDD